MTFYLIWSDLIWFDDDNDESEKKQMKYLPCMTILEFSLQFCESNEIYAKIGKMDYTKKISI